MAYTFGGGTGDDINWQGVYNIGNSTVTTLVMGWWYPTTLTATRGLWSAGNVVGAEIDSTTDELRLRSDNTTDGQWTTAGVDLAVDNWYFLAFLCSMFNTGPAVAWRVWRATIDTPPVEATVSVATSPSGNNSGNTLFYVGNKGTGTVAFQGDIDWVHNVRTNAAVGAAHPFFLGAQGAIAQAEADLVLSRYVIPGWQGDLIWMAAPQQFTGLSHADMQFWAARSTQVLQLGQAADSSLQATINGATISQRRAPVQPRPLVMAQNVFRY